MYKNNLIQELITLSEEEFKRFGKFLLSPYFNSNAKFVVLYEYFYAHIEQLSNIDLDKKLIFQKLYPGERYNDDRFRNFIYKMKLLLHEFFIHEEFRQKKSLKDRLLLDAFSNRLLKRKVEKQFKKIETNFKQKDILHHEELLEYHKAIEKYYHYPEADRRSLSPNLIYKSLYSLNQFFITSKLLLSLEILSRKTLLQEDKATFYFLNYIPRYTLLTFKKEQPLIAILQFFVLFYKFPSSVYVDQSFNLFKKKYHSFSLTHRKMVLKTLINQMNWIHQSGETSYLKKMFELYVFGLEERILIHDGSLTVFDFTNIVTTASSNEEIEWAISFIDQYQDLLPAAEKEHAVILGRATVLYERKEYETIIKLLLPYSFKGSKFKYKFRFIILKTYTELVFEDSSYRVLMNREIKRVEKYIKEENIKLYSNKGTQKTKGFLNFLKIIKTILKHHFGRKPRQKNDIVLMINNMQPIIAKKWLLQKVEILE